MSLSDKINHENCFWHQKEISEFSTKVDKLFSTLKIDSQALNYPRRASIITPQIEHPDKTQLGFQQLTILIKL